MPPPGTTGIRSAYVHVLADAVVSIWRSPVCCWPNSTAGFGWTPSRASSARGDCNWSVTLIRDTAGVLLDVCPTSSNTRKAQANPRGRWGSCRDLHLWRLGAGTWQLCSAIATSKPRDALFYRGRSLLRMPLTYHCRGEQGALRDDGRTVIFSNVFMTFAWYGASEIRACLAPLEGDPGLLVHSPGRILPGRPPRTAGLRPLQRLPAQDPAGGGHVGRLPGVRSAVPGGESAWNYVLRSVC